MKKTILLAGAAALALAGHAGAQEADTTGDGATTKLDRILVTTPLRRETTLERSTSSVTVIDAEEIKRSAAPDLPSLLKSYTGVSITNSGGQGSLSNVSIRGLSPGQTLVLVDGVRISSATSGTASIFNIPLASIGRIEIAKGAHSAQYGSDAMGGVINIITRKGDSCDNGKAVCGSATVGITHPWGGTASADVRGRTQDGLTYAIGGNLLGTRGYDFMTWDNPSHEDGANGFRQGGANVSASKDFEWGAIYGNALFARGWTSYDNKPIVFYDPPFDNEQYTTTFAGKIGSRIDHSESWSSTIELYSGLDNQKNFRKGEAGSSRFDTARYGVFASTEKSFDTGSVANVVTGGVESYREKINSTVDYDVDARTISSVFGQYSAEYEALRLDSGVRYDHNSQFGGATTFNVGASYEIVPDLTLRSSYATGFRAPTFNDLYFPADPVWGPSSNPNLKPEKSRSLEVGLNWQASADTSFDLAVYENRLTDAIVFQAGGPVNIARARVTGFEASVAHRFSSEWSGAASLDIRRPIDLATGDYIVNRDRLKATAELTYAPTEQLTLSTKVLYGGPRDGTGFDFMPTEIPGYVTADFTALYSVDERSQVKFSVENLFDKQYQTLFGYRAPGRTIDLSYTKTF